VACGLWCDAEWCEQSEEEDEVEVGDAVVCVVEDSDGVVEELEEGWVGLSVWCGTEEYFGDEECDGVFGGVVGEGL